MARLYTLDARLPEREARLVALGYQLPERRQGQGTFVPAVRAGNLVFVGGHGPLLPGGTYMLGKLGRELSVDEGYRAAQLAVLNCLATVKAEVGDLDRVGRIVKLYGMVNATSTFDAHTEVVNGASELLLKAFGQAGRHARTAVGMASLPKGIALEIELILETDYK